MVVVGRMQALPRWEPPPPAEIPLLQVDPGLVTLAWCGGPNGSCRREQNGKEGLGSRRGLRLLTVALQTAPRGGPDRLKLPTSSPPPTTSSSPLHPSALLVLQIP